MPAKRHSAEQIVRKLREAEADHLSAYIRRRAGVTMQLHRALLLRSWSLLNNPIDLRSEPRCEQPT